MSLPLAPTLLLPNLHLSLFLRDTMLKLGLLIKLCPTPGTNKGPTTAATPLSANQDLSATTESVLSQLLERSRHYLTPFLVLEQPAYLVPLEHGRSLGHLSATFACLAISVTM